LSARRIRSKLVRLTPEEFEEIERRAIAAGQLPACYLRNSALTGAPTPAPCSVASPDLLHALGTIGADLKAIVRAGLEPTTRIRAERVLGELVAILQQLAIERRGS
jgi:hypothetical protein